MSEWSVILEEEDKRRERKAFLVTMVTYAALIGACVFLVAFTMETPPPGQQFVAVGMADFGADQEAAGDREDVVRQRLTLRHKQVGAERRLALGEPLAGLGDGASAERDEPETHRVDERWRVWPAGHGRCNYAWKVHG